jgi:hypothetical protein
MKRLFTVSAMITFLGLWTGVQATLVIDLNALGNEGDPADQWKNEVNPSTYAQGLWTTPVLTSGTANGSPVTFYRNPDGPEGGGFKNESSVSPLSATGLSNWTYEMWLRRTYANNTSGNGEVHIARFGTANNGSGDPWFALDNGNDFGGGCMGCDITKLDYFLLPGFDAFADEIDNYLPIVDADDGPFSQLVFTLDSSGPTLNVYIDGAEVRTHPLGIFPGWSAAAVLDDLDVFVNDIPTRSFPGDISLVRLYDEALDQSAISAAYLAGPNVPEPGTLALLGLGGLLLAKFRRKS